MQLLKDIQATPLREKHGPEDIEHIAHAATLGLGSMEYSLEQISL